MIAALLDELGRLLPPGRLRRRVLLEAEDHLRCAAAAAVATGLGPADAEAAAVRDFGTPAALARQVRDQLATRAAIAACATGLTLLGALAAVYLLRFTELANDRGEPRWWPDEPLLSVVSLLAIEVAVVAGVVIAVRLLRHRAAAASGTVRAALLRGLLVASAAGTIAALADGVTALRHLDSVRSSRLALAVAGLGLVVLVMAASAATAGLRGLRVAPSEEAAPHPVDDLLALVPLAGRLAARHPRLTAAAALVDLRRHPWRVCAAVAALAFVLDTAGYIPRDGLAAASVEGAVQAAALVAAFALLGPVLGLRSRVSPRSTLPAAPGR